MNTITDLKNALAAAAATDAVSITGLGTALTLAAGDLDQALGVKTPGDAYVAWTVTRLRFRKTPGLAGVLIRAFAPDEKVTVLNVLARQIDGYLWVNVRDAAGEVGWCDQEYLTRVPPPPPKPTTGQFIGLHILQDGGTATEQFIGQLPNGHILPTATVVNDAGLVAYLASGHVARVVFRPNVTGTSADDPTIPTDDPTAEHYGQSWAWAKLAGLPTGLKRDNVFVQVANEVEYAAGHNGFWLGVMKACEALGFKAAIGAYSVGTPEPDEWVTLTPALQYAQANGHVVCLHAYCKAGTPVGQLSAPGDQPYYELRFPRLYAAVPINAQPPLIISEFAHEEGSGKFEGTTALVQIADLYQTAVASCPYLAGFCLFTVGRLGGWASSSIDAALPTLATYLETGRL